MNILNAAFDLWRRGLSVIPVPLPDSNHDGKTPVIRWREFQDRLPTESELGAWFDDPCNIAVITGRISGVVVIDADSSEAIRWATKTLPYTPWQTRTARGFHLWYRHPGVRIGNRAKIDTRTSGRLDLDVRGDGGYVIGPGSIHATGVQYEFAGDWLVPRERLPFFWPGWIARPRREHQSKPASRPIGPVAERARRYLATIPRPEIGQGSDNETLYAACRLVRGFGLSEADTVEMLWEWAGGRAGWTREWISKKVRNAIRYGSEPIGALR